MIPIFYTFVEGGLWVKWPSKKKSLITADFDLRGKENVELSCGVRVHSLQFENGNEWDCITGWRNIK